MSFFKDYIIKSLTYTNIISKQQIQNFIETPPDKSLGDYSLPCFRFSKDLKKSPNQIAEEIKSKLILDSIIIKIENKNGYLNFYISKNELTNYTLKEISIKKDSYGSNKNGDKNLIMIEYSSPNTNKPLHLGHVRNNLIGMSMSRIYEFSGYKTIKSCVINDRGIHICKSMLAYQKWGKNKQPNKKPDHFVGDFYVLFSKKAQKKPSLEEEAQELLRKWEEHDKKTLLLWKKMNNWVYKGFNETYKILGSEFDKVYYESEFYEKGKEIVLKGLKDHKLIEKDGAIMADLSSFNLPNKILMRSDKTALYVTQDIYLTQLKFKEYPLKKSIYVVGNEQDMYFQQLFATLNILGYEWYKDCHHLSYGYVSLPSGRMKSREGTVIDADNLIEDLTSLAEKELKKRQKLSKLELKKRSVKISLAAIKYFFLKYETLKDFVFDQKSSLSFEGETGPYIQYTYARLNSIIKKSQSKRTTYDSNYLNSAQESDLINHLYNFPEIVIESTNNYKPSLIARYLMDLCQKSNEFYQKCPVINAEENLKSSRLFLIDSTRQVIKNCCYLLNIPLLESM